MNMHLHTSRRMGLVVAFVDGLRRGFLLRRLALTDVEIEPHTLVELLLLRVLAEDRFEKARGLLIRMALKRLEAALIQCDRLEIRGSPLRSHVPR